MANHAGHGRRPSARFRGRRRHPHLIGLADHGRLSVRLVPRLDEGCLLVRGLPRLLVQTLDRRLPRRHSGLVLLLLPGVRALPARQVLVVWLVLIAYLDVLEGRTRLHLVVVGLLHGHGDLLRVLLLWLLDAVVVHVDAQVLALPVRVDHELDGWDGLRLALNLGRVGSLVGELLFGLLLGVRWLLAQPHRRLGGSRRALAE